MNEQNLQLLSNFIDTKYINSGNSNIIQYNKQFTQLLSNKQIPLHPWSNQLIQYILQQCSIMDSNNNHSNIGVGEREGRCYSTLVYERHYGLTHGIGRSGDLYAQQPKAAGSSILVQVTHILTKHALKLCGLSNIDNVIVLPTATGMSITLALLALKQQLNDSHKQYVIWPRVDQKTCLKAIIASGYTPLIISNKLIGDELHTDIDAIHNTIQQYGMDTVACIISTTSCFAPRASDNIVAIAELCKQQNIHHIVNNAYGLQSTVICKQVNTAHTKGRIDCVIQSTDKNFMIPVGGAIVFDYNNTMTTAISKIYPGRASNTAHIDMFITLLSMGQTGLQQLLQQREHAYTYLKRKYSGLAQKYGERILETPNNSISLAMTVDTIATKQYAPYFGSMLYSRSISGPRCVSTLNSNTVDAYKFQSYGAHYDNYPYAYLTAAAAIGLTNSDIDEFIERLDKAIVQLQKYVAKHQNAANNTQNDHGYMTCGSMRNSSLLLLSNIEYRQNTQLGRMLYN